MATVRPAGQLLKRWEVLDMSDNSAFQMELIRTREAMERRLRELDKQEQSTTAPVYLLIPLTEEQRERIVRIAEGR